MFTQSDIWSKQTFKHFIFTDVVLTTTSLASVASLQARSHFYGSFFTSNLSISYTLPLIQNNLNILLDSGLIDQVRQNIYAHYMKQGPQGHVDTILFSSHLAVKAAFMSEIEFID